ncbi:GNAT family N-acetyltransferase [Paenibacillus caui]|uniref:GNAT family N-acetyltransferase n=1 Tax=Paenibacillus caui TaxID=2873927 RepID=UPI001CA9B451|nr:GNAT family N-acetyltransferase [Paenibacillus caui]
MEQIRPLRTEDLKEAARLADKVFRDAEQKSMGEAFPYIFAADAPESIGVYEGGRLAAFMGIVPGCIRIGPARLNVYSLGSVCTHPDARGKGYASRLLERAISHINDAGASLMLVSGERSLYLRAGCRIFGQSRGYVITPAIAMTHPDSFRIRSLQAGDSFAIASLAAQEEARYELSLYDLSLLIAKESLASCYKLVHRTLIAEQPGGDIAAFAVIGVPAAPLVKSVPKVIDAAGDPAAIAELCAHAVNLYRLNSLEVSVSAHRASLTKLLEDYGYGGEHHPNKGTVKIIDPARLWKQLLPYLRTRHPDADRLSVVSSPSTSGDGAIIWLDDTVSAELNMDGFLALIFNEHSDLQLPKDIGDLLSELLPIPFPYTGGLSYI